MSYSIIPARVLLEHPVEYKPAEIPTMSRKGAQDAVESGCVRHAMSGSTLDGQSTDPGSRI